MIEFSKSKKKKEKQAAEDFIADKLKALLKERERKSQDGDRGSN